MIIFSEDYFPNFNFFDFLVELLIATVEAISSIVISHNNCLIVFKEIYSKLISPKDRAEKLHGVNCVSWRDNTEGFIGTIRII